MSTIVHSIVPMLALPRTHGVTAPALVAGEFQRRFQEGPYPELRRLECEYHEGVVILHGRVASYHMKQMAQETIQTLTGIKARK